MNFKTLIRNLIRQVSQLEFTIQAYLLLGIFWSMLGYLLLIASEAMLFLGPFQPGVLDYGHLKPLSSLILIFGAFLSFVLGLGYYILQERLGPKSGVKVPMALAAFVCFKLHHFALLLGTVSVLIGFNKGRMLGEMPWFADDIFVPAFLCFPILVMIGFAGQKLKDISLSFLFLSLLGALFYYVLGNFSFPTGFFTSSPLFTGVQDMALQELYLSGLLYFVILAGLFGVLYYYVPLYYRTELYSSSIPVFVSLALLLLVPLGAMSGLVHTFAPSYLQSLGIFCSMALNFAMVAGGLNVKYSITRSSTGKKYRSDAVGLMLRMGIFFLLFTALARALFALPFMQAWSAYGTFALRDPIFNISSYGLLLLFPLALLVLQKITARTYAKGLLGWLAFFWIIGTFLFYMGSLGAGLAEHFKASALDPEGQELLVQNWSDVFFSAKLFVGDALWAQYLLSFRGLALSGNFLITLGLLFTGLYVFACSLRGRLQSTGTPYEMPDLEFHPTKETASKVVGA